MIEEGDPIWNLMVSCFIQNYTDEDGMKSDDRGRISDERDLAQ